jgi:hypothetical protein
VLSSAACSIPLVMAQQTRAEEVKVGDVVVTFSGAATAGAEIRAAPRNPAYIFIPNGQKLGVRATAIAGSSQDDGNLNYPEGSVVSSVAKAYSTVDARYQNFGVFVTAKGATLPRRMGTSRGATFPMPIRRGFRSARPASFREPCLSAPSFSKPTPMPSRIFGKT